MILSLRYQFDLLEAINTYIDILVKLIIAFLGIIAPLTAYLLANFNKHINALHIHINGLQGFIDEKEKEENFNQKDSEYIEAIKILKQEEENLEYIEPKKNISTIFIFLFSALAVLVVNIFIKTNCDCKVCFCCAFYLMSIFLSFFSTLLFGCGVWSIQKVIWAYIDTKKMVEDFEKEGIEQKKEGNKIEPNN